MVESRRVYISVADSGSWGGHNRQCELFFFYSEMFTVHFLWLSVSSFSDDFAIAPAFRNKDTRFRWPDFVARINQFQPFWKQATNRQRPNKKDKNNNNTNNHKRNHFEKMNHHFYHTKFEMKQTNIVQNKERNIKIIYSLSLSNTRTHTPQISIIIQLKQQQHQCFQKGRCWLFDFWFLSRSEEQNEAICGRRQAVWSHHHDRNFKEIWVTNTQTNFNL